jgi:uncharacterized protein (TIGR03067 family)
MNWLPVIGLALALGAPGSKEAPKKAEAPAIVGEWECVEFVGGGRVATERELAQIQLGIEFRADGTCRIREGSPKGPRFKDGKYTTDPSKDPAQFDFSIDKGGNVARRIYKIEKDLLVICGSEGIGERPTKFESPTDTRIVLVTFRRVESKK